MQFRIMFSINKILNVGECHPPQEEKVSSYGGWNLNEQIDNQIRATPEKANTKTDGSSEELEDSDKDDFEKEISNDFWSAEKVGD